MSSLRYSAVRRCVAALGFGAWLAFLVPCLPARADDTQATFDSAARLYEQGKFNEAIAAYQKLLTNGVVTAPLLYNLGNAWLQEGELGQAIAAYRQARRISPRDRDIAANLRFARSKVTNGPRTQPGVASRALRVLTPNEWAGLALILTWLGCGALIVRGWRPKLLPVGSGLTTALATLALLSTAAAVAASYQDNRPAAVVTTETPVRFGPLQEAQQAFTLPDGAEVRIADRKQDWLQVRDAAGRVGWLPGDSVVQLN